MFDSLAAHQMFNKMGVLQGLLLKPRLFEQFECSLGAPVVPPMKDLGKAPILSHLQGREN